MCQTTGRTASRSMSKSWMWVLMYKHVCELVYQQVCESFYEQGLSRYVSWSVRRYGSKSISCSVLAGIRACLPAGAWVVLWAGL